MSTTYQKRVLGRVRNALLGAAVNSRDYVGDSFWLLKKRIQLFKLTHFSLAISGILVLLVTFRETPEISRFILSSELPGSVGLLILFVLFLTYLAFGWEKWGDKRTTSAQELRFQYGAKRLLREMELLRTKLEAAPGPQQEFTSFLNKAVELVSNTFSVKIDVDAGIMLKDPEKDVLYLRFWNFYAQYPQHLGVPLPIGEDCSNSGPAGVAFTRKSVVYVPKKSNKRAWLFVALEDLDLVGLPEPTYDPIEKFVCWVKAPNPKLEDFYTVVCAPIAISSGLRNYEKFGVLNLSTKAHDPFVDRDFFMLEFFATALGQAFDLRFQRAIRDAESS